MMKVYTVLAANRSPYDKAFVMGVYKTRALAQVSIDYAKRGEKFFKYDYDFEIEEFEVGGMGDENTVTAG